MRTLEAAHIHDKIPSQVVARSLLLQRLLTGHVELLASFPQLSAAQHSCDIIQDPQGRPPVQLQVT